MAHIARIDIERVPAIPADWLASGDVAALTAILYMPTDDQRFAQSYLEHPEWEQKRDHAGLSMGVSSSTDESDWLSPRDEEWIAHALSRAIDDTHNDPNPTILPFHYRHTGVGNKEYCDLLAARFVTRSTGEGQMYRVCNGSHITVGRYPEADANNPLREVCGVDGQPLNAFSRSTLAAMTILATAIDQKVWGR